MTWSEQARERIYGLYELILSYKYQVLLVIVIIIFIYIGLWSYSRIIGNIKEKKISIDTNDWWSWEKYYDRKTDKKDI